MQLRHGVLFIEFWILSWITAAQPASQRTAVLMARQQAEERHRQLVADIEDLQAANLALQKRIEGLERETQRLRRQLNRQQAQAITSEQLKSLSDELTKQIRQLDHRRVSDNKRILAQLKTFLKQSSWSGSPAVATTAATPTTAEPDQPGTWVTIEEGYTISAIVQELRKQGADVAVEDVLRVNPTVKPKSLRPGQRLFVPIKNPQDFRKR